MQVAKEEATRAEVEVEAEEAKAEAGKAVEVILAAVGRKVA